MTTRAKATLITAAVALVVLIAVVIFALSTRPDAPDNSDASATNANSHVLDDAGPDAPVLVEFLDFECEACGGLYPIIEEVRQVYEGEITYVVRYFPLPGHVNSMNAAIAAEAAAEQGEFEAMFHRLFETQTDWGEQRESQPELFRSFAEDIGLDMAAYDASVADPATQERVEQDLLEGQRLGVTTTPTFFLDGKKLELTQLSDLTGALNDAIGPR